MTNPVTGTTLCLVLFQYWDDAGFCGQYHKTEGFVIVLERLRIII